MTGPSRFSGVALHWLLGLLHLNAGEEGRGLAEFEHELSLEGSGHLYARECCANTWYAVGALKLRQGRLDEARDAFTRATERVPAHPMARVGLAAIAAAAGRTTTSGNTPSAIDSIDAAMARAAYLAAAGRHAEAAQQVDRALAVGPPGNGGWLIPVEPLLNVAANPAAWTAVLARIRTRAA